MADITTNTLKIGDNNLILRDADAQAQITTLKEEISELSSIPTTVRQAMLTLFESAAYAETGLTDEIAVVESWAEEVTSLALDQTAISISGSGTVQLVATTVPAGKTVTWSSSDDTIATVSASGLVTGVSNGAVTITAACGDKRATCAATVSGFATLVSISAVYTQSGTVNETDSLDSLKDDLVVTAHYSDSTTRTVTDYVLSGTLTVGTSMITVSYSGKTATFNVVVSAEYGDDYTWLYKASDGNLLSERTDLVTPTIGSGCTETLVDGLLHLFVPKNTSSFIRYKLVQTTNENAKITAKVKFGSIPYADAGTAFRLQVSNGTNGAQIFEHYDNTSYKFGTFEGATYTDKLPLELDTWYIISVERNNGAQIVTVDRTEILNSSTLSTNYCTSNAIFGQNAPKIAVNDLNVDIEWITYKNND